MENTVFEGTIYVCIIKTSQFIMPKSGKVKVSKYMMMQTLQGSFNHQDTFTAIKN
jgi:hypothetical protein